MGIKDIYVKTNQTNQAVIFKSFLQLLVWFQIGLETHTLLFTNYGASATVHYKSKDMVCTITDKNTER